MPRKPKPNPEQPATLAQPKYDGLPKYELLSRTVKTTLYSSGRFPTSTRDMRPALVDEALALALGAGLLDKPDEEMIPAAKSVARQVIYRFKKLKHPVANDDRYTDLMSDYETDVFGQPRGINHTNLNQSEEAMVQHLDGMMQRYRVLDCIGSDAYKRLIALLERGNLTVAERGWVFRIKKKIRKLVKP